MIKQNLLIDNIPTILWGKKSSKLFVAVHGNMANKSDPSISILAALEVMENGEHYFHTPEQLEFFRQWLKEHLYK